MRLTTTPIQLRICERVLRLRRAARVRARPLPGAAGAAGAPKMAAEGEQDDAVVIEELGPDGEPVTAAAPAEEDTWHGGGTWGDAASG